jgi:hypothetical protein
MLEHALKQRAALQDFISNHVELKHLTFDANRWKRLTQIRDFLSPFEEITREVSRDEPTLTMVPALYVKMEKLLKSIINKEGEYASFDASLIAAAKQGLKKFDEYYVEMKENDIYWIACVLDPRIKTKWLKRNIIEADEIIDRIKTFLKRAYPVEPELPSQSREGSQKKKKSLAFEYLEEYGTSVEAENDIDRYFDLPAVQFVLDEKEDQAQWVLNWWASNKTEFPRMCAIARDYLPIPGAEVDVERLFNVARDVLGLRRSSLGADTLRALILVKDYLRRKQLGHI